MPLEFVQKQPRSTPFHKEISLPAVLIQNILAIHFSIEAYADAIKLLYSTSMRKLCVICFFSTTAGQGLAKRTFVSFGIVLCIVLVSFLTRSKLEFCLVMHQKERKRKRKREREREGEGKDNWRTKGRRREPSKTNLYLVSAWNRLQCAAKSTFTCDPTCTGIILYVLVSFSMVFTGNMYQNIPFLYKRRGAPFRLSLSCTQLHWRSSDSSWG